LHLHKKQFAATREVDGPDTVGQQAEVPDAHESRRNDVQEESAEELAGFQRHEFGLVALSVVLPPKDYVLLIRRDQPAIGDGKPAP